MDEALSQVTSAALVIYGLQLAKSIPWVAKVITWVPMKDAHVHRLLAAGGALVTAVGIHYVFEGNADIGWHLHFEIPPMVTIRHDLWEFAKAYAFQQTGYNLLSGQKI